ncbi:MAG: hypothetical protein JSW70_01075 [Syntrophobacterales bacterium]|nr:MAG: hypothetical protein JSW70_01075 [Syntrophobacterales bacterium]
MLTRSHAPMMERIKINLSMVTEPQAIHFTLFPYNIGVAPLFFKGRGGESFLSFPNTQGNYNATPSDSSRKTSPESEMDNP